MRLHNRQVKAAFWTDPELLQLSRDKRMFYQGLWQLADDSGCLEDSPFAFKIQIYPSPIDEDITPDVLAEWRDDFIAMKKAIPYTADGKECLFLVNFHKHQALRSPAPPDVPLPPWVEWKPGEKPKAPGKYVVNEANINRKESVRTPYDMQPEPEPEIEPEPFIDDDDNSAREGEGRSEIVSTFEQEFGRLISPTEFERLMAYIKDGMPEEIVSEAIKRARLHGSTSVSYTEKVLNNWKDAGVVNMAGVERVDTEFEKRKRQRDGPKNQSTKPKGDGKYAKLGNAKPEDFL